MAVSPRQVLLLGRPLHGRDLTAFEWSELPDRLNFADYSDVILDLSTIEAAQEPAILARAQDAVWFAPLARFVWSGAGELVIIGCQPTLPTFLIPQFPEIADDAGEFITEIDDEFADYFEDVDRYDYILRSDRSTTSPNCPQFIGAAISTGSGVMTQSTPLAKTRSGDYVAVRLQIRPGNLEQRWSKPIIWLPAPTARDASSVISRLLANRYGVGDVSAPRPTWLDQYPLPRQQRLMDELTSLQTQLDRLEDEAAEVDRQRADVAGLQSILFEQGEDGLEPPVQRALRELGAELIPSPRRGWHDGTLRYGGGSAVLEIKGRTGAVGLADVRQLAQWVDDLRFPDDNDIGSWEGIGLLIANAHSTQEPTSRPPAFASNALEFALRRDDMCLLTTPQLFSALCELQRDELDVDAWWARIFAARGLFS